MRAGLALAAAAGVLLASRGAAAGDTGGHWLDVGVLSYLEAGDRGGAKAEVRVNLAPSELDAGLYLSAGGGFGTWEKRNTIGSVWETVVSGGDNQDLNYTQWNIDQGFLDLGLQVVAGQWTIGGGLMVVGWDARVEKKINGDPYRGEGEGSNIGGWGHLGREIPIGNWFVDLLLGYRQTRGKPDILTTNGVGATNVAMIRPITGFTFHLGLRYRI